MRSKKLEQQLGLEQILKSLEHQNYHCSHCKNTRTHKQYELSWLRHFNSTVEFRQSYQIRVCSACNLTSFVENTWCEELDEFDLQGDGNETVESNYHRFPDNQKIIFSNYDLEQVLVLQEIRHIFTPDEVLFVEEVIISINAGLYDLAAVGVRSIIEKISHLVGTTSAREKFTKTKAKELDGTSKTKNNYSYKLLWLMENGLVSVEQNNALQSVINLGNFAAHRMDMTASLNKKSSKKHLLKEAFKTIYALTINYKQSKFNE